MFSITLRQGAIWLSYSSVLLTDDLVFINGLGIIKVRGFVFNTKMLLNDLQLQILTPNRFSVLLVHDLSGQLRKSSSPKYLILLQPCAVALLLIQNSKIL